MTAAVNASVLGLLRHPDQLELVRRDPAVADHAGHELSRWYSATVEASSTLAPRRALIDTMIDGEPVKAGDMVFCVRGQADLAISDQLDVQRRGRHLAFSYGPHICPGASIARSLLGIAVPALVRRFPHLTLSEDTGPGYPDFLRGPTRLMITW